MSGKEKHSQPIGICQRLLNFFVSCTCSPKSAATASVDGSMKQQSSLRHAVDSKDEDRIGSAVIQVHFKQHEVEGDDEVCIPIHEEEHGVEGDDEVCIPIHEEVPQEQSNKQRKETEHEKAKMEYPRAWSVPENINEIAEAFIESRLGAMRRSLS